MNTTKLFDQLVYCAVLAIAISTPFTKGAIETSLLLGIGAFFYLKILKKEFNPNEIPLIFPLILYLVAIELSMMNNPNLGLTGKGLIKTLKHIAVYLIAVETVRTEKRFVWILRIILFAAFLSCWNGFYQRISGWDFRHCYPLIIVRGVTRVAGSFNHPNNFAAYLATVILISLYSRDHFFWQVAKYFYVPFYFGALFLTNSRMPLIFMIVSLALSIFISKKFRQFSVHYFLIAIGCCVLYFVFKPSYFIRLLDVMKGDGRLQYWIYSVELAKQRPFLGSGINSFMNIYANYPPTFRYGPGRFIYAHNFILQMWVEIGLLGLCSFFYFLKKYFSLITDFLRHKDDAVVSQSVFGLLVGIVFFLLHSLVDNDMQSLQLSTFFWLLIGCTIGISRQNDRPKA